MSTTLIRASDDCTVAQIHPRVRLSDAVHHDTIPALALRPPQGTHRSQGLARLAVHRPVRILGHRNPVHESSHRPDMPQSCGKRRRRERTEGHHGRYPANFMRSSASSVLNRALRRKPCFWIQCTKLRVRCVVPCHSCGSHAHLRVLSGSSTFSYMRLSSLARHHHSTGVQARLKHRSSGTHGMQKSRGTPVTSREQHWLRRVLWSLDDLW